MADLPSRTFYDAFYAKGGWKYGFIREWWWHRRHMVRRFRLRRGWRMLEVGCGTGFHTDLFCRMGFRCVGMDSCPTGVGIARSTFPARRFHLCDARGILPFGESSFEVVVTRGCSPYHYDLRAQGTIEMTANLMRCLSSSGLFILIIASDLSGRREPGRIWQNRLDDYHDLFNRFDRNCIVDWHKGMVICGARRRS